MALSKMLPVDLAAVRATAGEERKKWHEALKKEYVRHRSRLARVPGRVVLTLKPVDTLGGERGVKRKAQIVLCGNFIPDYSVSATKNLDVSALRCFLNVLVRRNWQFAAIDVPGQTGKSLLSPPKILAEFGRGGPCGVLEVAEGFARRDEDLARIRFSVGQGELALWRSRVHDSIWLVQPSCACLRFSAASKGSQNLGSEDHQWKFRRNRRSCLIPVP
eukprot:1371752-Amphidinium_carterae.4